MENSSTNVQKRFIALNGWGPIWTLNSRKRVEGADMDNRDNNVNTRSTCPLEIYINPTSGRKSMPDTLMDNVHKVHIRFSDQMGQKDSKWPQVGQNCFRLLQMAQNGSRCVKMGQNCSKWLVMAPNGSK